MFIDGLVKSFDALVTSASKLNLVLCFLGLLVQRTSSAPVVRLHMNLLATELPSMNASENACHSSVVALQDFSASALICFAISGCIENRPATAPNTTLCVQLKVTQAASMNFSFVVILFLTLIVADKERIAARIIMSRYYYLNHQPRISVSSYDQPRVLRGLPRAFACGWRVVPVSKSLVCLGPTGRGLALRGSLPIPGLRLSRFGLGPVLSNSRLPRRRFGGIAALRSAGFPDNSPVCGVARVLSDGKFFSRCHVFILVLCQCGFDGVFEQREGRKVKGHSSIGNSDESDGLATIGQLDAISSDYRFNSRAATDQRVLDFGLSFVQVRFHGAIISQPIM